MKENIKFILIPHRIFEVKKLIKKENSNIQKIKWSNINQKISSRVNNSTYNKNNDKLNIIISNAIYSNNPVAFQGHFKLLCITPKMVAKLYTDNNDIAVINFFSSVGHEKGHNNDYKPAYILQFLEKFHLLPRKGKEFERIMSWPNEVYADYYSLSKWLNGDIELFIDCIQYKSKGNTITNTHPSWSMRINYLQKKKFDKDLLYEILKDTECKNNNRINKYANKLYKHYCKYSPNNDVTTDLLLT